MPSSTFTAAALAERTGEIALELLTLTHPNMAVPLRVTSDSVQTISNGNVFIAYPFAITLARSSNDSPPTARLTISNVDRRIVEALRALPLEPPLDVVITTVLASDPDTVEFELAGYQLRAADYDAQRVTGDLVPDLLDREPWPSVRFLPSTFPGVF